MNAITWTVSSAGFGWVWPLQAPAGIKGLENREVRFSSPTAILGIISLGRVSGSNRVSPQLQTLPSLGSRILLLPLQLKA